MRLKTCLTMIAAAYLLLAQPVTTLAAELPAKNVSAVAWHFGPACLMADSVLTCQWDRLTHHSIVLNPAQEEIEAVAQRHLRRSYSDTVSHGTPVRRLTCPDQLC